ncbi:MAG TPA: MFS transporter [Lacisediminihabitans sp.]|uniref:MFS transporter n=1 Tax=Lacisediminihabitans sp. TaxID=2787631 RepID=UPI002ED8A13E
MTTESTAINPATEPIPVLLERPKWRDTFDSLRVFNYRLYVISQMIANTSGWMQKIATDWLVNELTHNVALVGVTVFLQFAPVLVFGVWGGVLADRVDKRKLMMTTQSVTAILCASLGVITLLGLVTVWEVWGVAFLLGLVAVVEGPARSAFVNEMVGHRRLRNAISLNASIFHLGGLLGPAISGVLIAIVGSGWSISVNALAAAIVVLTFAMMRVRELLPSPRADRSKGQIREGLSYVVSKPTIFWPMIMLAFVSTFGMTLPVLLVSFADTVYKTGATGYGLYSSAAAVGALSGAVLSTRRLTVRLRTIMFAAGLFGTALVVAGLTPWEPLFMVFLVSIGLSRLLFATGAESIVQLSTNRAIRGRVMSVYSMIMLGGQALGGPISGAIADRFGVHAAMVVAGVVPAIAAVVISMVLARSGKLSLSLRLHRPGKLISIVPRRRRMSRPAQ